MNGFVVEDEIGCGCARFVTYPGLNDIKPLRGLMDIVKIGNVAEGLEQLDQTFGSVADEVDFQDISIPPDRIVMRPQAEFTGHLYPRSFPDHRPLEPQQAYANSAWFRTTNMGLSKDLHKIFEMPLI